ncbi:MAG: hypothetical protein ACRD51_06895, partial [Candidatus Acidiferrum sp.]
QHTSYPAAAHLVQIGYPQILSQVSPNSQRRSLPKNSGAAGDCSTESIRRRFRRATGKFTAAPL